MRAGLSADHGFEPPNAVRCPHNAGTADRATATSASAD
jgi:hypothetical protein